MFSNYLIFPAKKQGYMVVKEKTKKKTKEVLLSIATIIWVLVKTLGVMGELQMEYTEFIV